MNTLRKIWCRAFQTGFYIALPILPYRDPKTYSSIDDILAIINRKEERRGAPVLIVTDQGIVRAGLLRMLTESLDRSGVRYVVYDQVVPNPTIDNVEAARAMYVEHGCAGFIALGGGSAMDCTKAAACRIARPNKSVPQMKGILRVWRQLPLLIAIPTTAGTGSETTLAAVITDSREHHKYAIMDFPLIPRHAVLDYRLTTGLPKHITATTGMDALTHAVEAYIGRSTTRQTRAMAEEATRLIHQYLYRAYLNGDDAEARQQMLRAAFCAGSAFSQSYVGYVHAVAHSLGGQYGTPHGLANSVILPIVLREYGAHAEAKLARLARRAGVVPDGRSDHDTAALFIDWIQQMNDQMQIPRRIEGIRDEDIPMMARHADAEANPLYPVPVLYDAKELERFYHLVKA